MEAIAPPEQELERLIGGLPVHSPRFGRIRDTTTDRGVRRDDSRDDDIDDLKGLAVAVIKNAVTDLAYKQTRDDAKKFLMVDLWDEDSLWRSIIGELPRHLVEREVNARLNEPSRTHPRCHKKAHRAGRIIRPHKETVDRDE